MLKTELFGATDYVFAIFDVVSTYKIDYAK